MNGTLRVGSVVVIACLVGLFVGCQGYEKTYQEADTTREASQEVESVEELKVMEDEEDKGGAKTMEVSESEKGKDLSIHYDEMVARSLLQTGNNHRMKEVIKKAKAGEPVTIAYLGGSITQGGNASPSDTNSYAYLSYEHFKTMFGNGDNVQYVNAGVAGTPSTFGIVRVNKDVLSYKPDVVVVEFAVNDEGKPLNQYIYESLVRKILKSESQPAVILMFTVFEKGHNAQAHMQQVGEYYDLGMIAVKQAIFPEIEAGRMVFKDDYGKDGLHPDNQGHKMIADFFKYYFEQVDAENNDADEPVQIGNLFDKSYENLYSIDFESGMVKDMGGFVKEPIECFTYKEGLVKDTSVDKGITMELAFDEMIIAHQQFNQITYGTVNVYVDDTLVTSIEGYKKEAWSNVIVTVVENPYKDGKAHQVRLEMDSEDKEKKFVLVDIGVVQR